jgi:hypothetical protein
MDNATVFRGGQATSRLLDYFKGKAQWQRAVPPHTRFERFTTDEFHRIKAFTVLFAVVHYPRNIWMLNLRSGPCFTQKACPSSRILGKLATDYL